MTKQQLPEVKLPEFDVALLDNANKRLLAAQMCVINNDADYEACGAELKSDTAHLRVCESMLKQMTDPLQKALKQIRSVIAPPGEILEKARNLRSRRMGEYQNNKLAEQRRLQQIADEQAAKERQRLEKLADKAEQRGDGEKAAALVHQAAATVAPVIRTDAPSIAGQSVREVWQFQIVDASLIPRKYLVPDEKMLGQIARAMKAQAEVPGVRFYSEKRVASGV